MDDDTDARILRALSADARATLADLSAAIGLSVSAVQAR
ncbi:AsnC family transcriptional regulator, partial [Microbacterium sp. NPDC076895]